MKTPEELEKEKAKQTERLIKAVLSLDKRFVEADKKSKTGKLMGRAAESITKKMSDVFSVRGVAGALGISRGSLLGSLIDERHEEKLGKRAERKSEARQALTFAKSYGKFTEMGRGLSGKEALRRGTEVYAQKKTINKQIKEIESEIEQARELGPGADIAPERRAELNRLTLQRENLLRPPSAQLTEVTDPKKKGKTAPVSKRAAGPAKLDMEKITAKDEIRPGDMIGNARVSDVIAKNEEKKAPESFEEMILRKEKEQIAAKASKITAPGVVGSIPEGDAVNAQILEVEKDQLSILKRIEENSVPTEEERLRNEILKPKEPTKREKEKKEKTSNGLFDSLSNLTSMLGGFFPELTGAIKILGSLGPMLSTIASIAGPALALAGAGAAGYMVGTKLINPALNATARTITGDKTDTLGTAIGKLTGQDDRLAVEDRTRELVLYKVAKNVPLSKEESSFLQRNVSLMPARIKEIYDSKMNPKLSKPEITGREMQSQVLENKQAAVEKMANEKVAGAITAPATTIIQNTANNTTLRQTKLNPPVRNIEPSFNDRLRRSFS